MFADQLAAAIEAAQSAAALDHLSRAIWQGVAAEAIADADAQRLAEMIQARRTAARAVAEGQGGRGGRPSIFPPRRPQRAPVRAVSIARRRHLAASGPLPPTLASRFTTGELAVLKIVADEIRTKGTCERTLAEIAARAGVCRSLVQNALRRATEELLLTVEERRLTGQRNLPNRVQIVAHEWLTWLQRGPRPTKGGGGFKSFAPTGRDFINQGPKTARNDLERGFHKTRSRGGG
jgi:hypothetical protein